MRLSKKTQSFFMKFRKNLLTLYGYSRIMKSVKERDKLNPYTEVGNMKNAKEFMITTYNGNGEEINTVWRKSHKAVSNYANRMIDKYGYSTTVEVWYMDQNYEFHKYGTWHA